MVNYCHNCKHYETLTDGAHCAYCLRFWYATHRMPLPIDNAPELPTTERRGYVPATESIARVSAAMGWK
jgi:hypothetical protein